MFVRNCQISALYRALKSSKSLKPYPAKGKAKVKNLLTVSFRFECKYDFLVIYVGFYGIFPENFQKCKSKIEKMKIFFRSQNVKKVKKRFKLDHN